MELVYLTLFFFGLTVVYVFSKMRDAHNQWNAIWWAEQFRQAKEGDADHGAASR